MDAQRGWSDMENNTSLFRFNVLTPFHFNRTGKFEALTADWKHNRFTNEDFELIVVTDDTLYLTSRQKNYAIKAGDYLLLGPYLNQRSNLDIGSKEGYKESKCSFYWLHFLCSNTAFLSRPTSSFIDYGQDSIVLPEQGHLFHPQKVLLLMRQLQDCVKSGYDMHYLNYFTTLILCEISNQYRLLKSSQKSVRKNASKDSLRLYNDIIDFISYYPDIGFKVSDIAEHFGYNEKYISRYFKKVSGITLKQYIINYKIDQANFLLLDTNLSINDIAEKCGFSDYHNFIRNYKSATSMTPSEYRNTYSKRILNYD